MKKLRAKKVSFPSIAAELGLPKFQTTASRRRAAGRLGPDFAIPDCQTTAYADKSTVSCVRASQTHRVTCGQKHSFFFPCVAEIKSFRRIFVCKTTLTLLIEQQASVYVAVSVGASGP